MALDVGSWCLFRTIETFFLPSRVPRASWTCPNCKRVSTRGEDPGQKIVVLESVQKTHEQGSTVYTVFPFSG